jgi:hypothetical protein
VTLDIKRDAAAPRTRGGDPRLQINYPRRDEAVSVGRIFEPDAAHVANAMPLNLYGRARLEPAHHRTSEADQEGHAMNCPPVRSHVK